MNLIVPKKLKRGDHVGFISPSAGLAPFAMHRIKRAIATFEEMGYVVKIGKYALKNSGYVSASVQERADDIHEMFRDPKVKMIMATIGGHNSNQLLKYLDYKLIKKNPKIFIGYSDNTVLHYAFQSQANLATYYGPCVMTQFGEYPKILDYTLAYFKYALSDKKGKKSYKIEPPEFWTEEFLDWFKKEDEKRPREMQKNIGYEWLRKGKATGELLGGTIPSVNHLAGTKYWCDPKDKIFFLDIPEGHIISEGMPLQDVDSFLAELDNLGFCDSINGLIIGKPYHYSSEQVKEFKQIILNYAGKKNCPILYNTNIGHTDPIVTLRYGAIAELDSSVDTFRVRL
mgnify:FL=1